MTDLIDIAVHVQQVLEQQQWRFCFIGGIAVQQWGEPRITRDVDLSLFTGFGGEQRFIQELLRHFQPRVEDCEAFALRNRVLLLLAQGNIGIDVALAGLPFEAGMIQRAVLVEVLPGKQLRLCTAEDLIVLKAFAARPVDWHDVQSIVIRQGSSALDWGYIQQQLQPLAEAKEEPEILLRLGEIRDQ
jgi:predicted nucleotidyltransferase